MMKTSRFWLTRNAEACKNLLGKPTNVKEFLPMHNFTSRCGISTSTPIDGINSAKTYADFAIFKGKAALSVAPVLPKFSKINDGSSKLNKNGTVMLTFMPAIGLRKYDWQKKQAFALSPTEVGCLISLGPAESCEFFHDPSMKSSLEGQVKKTFTVSPNDSGYFFSLNVLNSIQKTTERFSVPVTKAEFAVMRIAFSFILPHIMGWDQIVLPLSATSGVSQSASGLPQSANNMQKRLSPDLEWSR